MSTWNSDNSHLFSCMPSNSPSLALLPFMKMTLRITMRRPSLGVSLVLREIPDKEKVYDHKLSPIQHSSLGQPLLDSPDTENSAYSVVPAINDPREGAFTLEPRSPVKWETTYYPYPTLAGHGRSPVHHMEA